MDKDTLKSVTQLTIGLAALLNMLEEKGIITEAEYTKYYKDAQKVIIEETLEKMKSELF